MIWSCIVLFVAGCAPQAPAPLRVVDLSLTLDRETLVDGAPLTSSTQSVNRFHSVLRDLSQVDVELGEWLSLRLHDDAGREVAIEHLDPRFLTPLLPYPHGPSIDAFDAANLFLAEFARSGVSVSHQARNDRLATFYAPELLPRGEEYQFVDGAVRPNPTVRPTRVSVTNNCLATGLWELAATDSVGEMYHSWFDLPEATAYELIRRANHLTDADAVLATALAYKEDLGATVDLDRLRTVGPELHRGAASIVGDKAIGSYSTQDSRRKVQRGFFRVQRPTTPAFAPATFADLLAGDQFSMHAFVPPGVYTPTPPEVVPFEPDWTQVEMRRVTPLTRFEGQTPMPSERGYVEIVVRKATGDRAIVAGNLPVDLLVFQEDFSIPAFGAGVHRASELVERRMLRYEQGPRPSFAYLFDPRDRTLLNNHEAGYEQLFLRPFLRDDLVWMRFTVVAYERIVDLVELEWPVPEPLASEIRAASDAYRPPLYRSYRDDNLL